jgi:WD40-like Beta Propeller Repeat
LYFSSTRAGGFLAEPPPAVTGDADIYVSIVATDGSVEPPVLVHDVNSGANEFRPALRRDGLELYFDSNRPGGAGGLDIWSATRPDRWSQWIVASSSERTINSSANETRPFLTWDATLLYFGSTRPGGEGSTDVFLAFRTKVSGRDKVFAR